MLIDYVSDLHINHYVPFIHNQDRWEKRTKEWTSSICETQTGVSDLLVVAGDFSEWNQQSIWFLEEARNFYETIFFVTGNHDYYLISKAQHRKFKHSKGRQSDFVERAARIPGVHPLLREVCDYNGIKIAGDSLWYPLLPSKTRYE